MSEETLITGEAEETQEVETDQSVKADSEGTDQSVGSEDENTHKPEFEEKPESKTEDKMYAGKYKSVEDLEKGYKELTTKLREKAPEAPDEYTFDYSEDEELSEFENLNLNLQDDPLLNELNPVFKDAGLPQESVDKLIKSYLKYEANNAPKESDEKQKLGENADAIIKETNNFVAKNFKGEDKEIAIQLGQTAEGLKFLNRLSKMVGEQPVPSDVGTGGTQTTAEELFAQANELKKQNNGNLWGDTARRYEALMNQAAQIKAKQNT